MREINSNHVYEYDPISGTVEDCFGVKMVDLDEFVDELNMLMAEIKSLKSQLDKPAAKS